MSQFYRLHFTQSPAAHPMDESRGLCARFGSAMNAPIRNFQCKKPYLNAKKITDVPIITKKMTNQCGEMESSGSRSSLERNLLWAGRYRTPSAFRFPLFPRKMERTIVSSCDTLFPIEEKLSAISNFDVANGFFPSSDFLCNSKE